MRASKSVINVSQQSPNTDPEVDLIDRYEHMVDIQIQTLDGLDDKASTLLRIEALILGVLLTGVSIITETNQISVELSFGIIWLLVGFIALLTSMALAMFTHLSSRFRYGPSRHLGQFMASNRVPPQDYRNLLLDGYSAAVGDNREVVRINAARFRNTLEAALVGLISFGFATLLLVANLNSFWLDLVISVIGIFIAIFAVDYIHREDYITLEDRP